MQRTAVFVDAGYLFAQGSVLLTGTKQGRDFLTLDISAVVAELGAVVASQAPAAPLLRIYWYDAIRAGRPTNEQHALADFRDIKIRLGQVNSVGEQKGVDALIITDLAELGRNQAMSDAVLVSGDEDLRVGVLLAQQFGVRVHLLGIQPAKSNQSRSLVQEADTLVEWDAGTIQRFLAYTPPITATPATVAAAAATIDALIQPLITAIPKPDLVKLKAQFASSNQVPLEHDKALLRVGRIHYQQQTLSNAERSGLRTAFVRLVLAAP